MHGCISPDVKGTSDCLNYQLVHLMHVMLCSKLEGFGSHSRCVLCYCQIVYYNVKVCVTALQTRSFVWNLPYLNQFLACYIDGEQLAQKEKKCIYCMLTCMSS